MSDFDERYTIRRFPIAEEGEPGYQATRYWMEAEAFGFNAPKLTDAEIAKAISVYRADEPELTGVYPAQPDGYFPAERPVGTYESFTKALNVGGGTMIDAWLISGVTVRSDHRRQGILSQMMKRDLAIAKDAGIPIAALTASEGEIYRRYGFGPSTFQRQVEVDVTAGYRIDAPTVGRMQVVPLTAMFDLAPQIFARFHRRQVGSLDRQERYRYRASGQMYEHATNDEDLMAAIHVDDTGTPDGYVTYKHSGWDNHPLCLQVKDLIAANDQAYLELWRYLGTIDLVDSVKWGEAPEMDPLPWALNNSRRVKATESFDVVWFRVLDVPATLSARAYLNDGDLTFTVQDPLGHAAGTYHLSVANGVGSVTEAAAADSQVSMHVADLGTLYLGGIPVTQLAAAGKVAEQAQGGAAQAQRLLAPVSTVDCATYF